MDRASDFVPKRQQSQNGTPSNAKDGVLTQIPTDKHFKVFAESRIGGRAENQDSMGFVDTRKGLLLAVCDGMGGGPGGKTASLIAAAAIGNYVEQNAGKGKPEKLVVDAIQTAHQAIQEEVGRNRQLTGMGTTAAVLFLTPDYAVCAHVGDSRIYQFRGGSLVFRTKDHSLVANSDLTEEEARTASNSNIITQALGHNEVRPDVKVLPYLKGDRFLICSDGIWNMHEAKTFRKMLTSTPSVRGTLTDLMITTDTIGKEEGNHHDNMTAIIVKAEKNSKLKVKMTVKTKLLLILLAALLTVSLVFNIVFSVKSGGVEKEQRVLTDSIKKQSETIKSLQQEVEITKANAKMAKDNLQAASESVKIAAEAMDNASRAIGKESQTQESAESAGMIKYTVKRGDILDNIAKRYHVTVEDIKKANKLKDNRINIGQILYIPKK